MRILFYHVHVGNIVKKKLIDLEVVQNIRKLEITYNVIISFISMPVVNAYMCDMHT